MAAVNPPPSSLAPSGAPIPPPPGELDTDARAFVAEAVAYLEQPGYLMRAANVVGKPAESLLAALPDRGRRLVAKAVQKAMEAGLNVAITSLGKDASAKKDGAASRQEGHLHTVATAATGFAGGFFGMAGLPVELPATTAIMLRSIAAIARDNGADLSDPAVRLECLAVLALGGKAPGPIDADLEGEGHDEIRAMDSAYYTARVGLALALRSATTFVAGRAAGEVAEAVARGSAPALVRLVSLIAARFNVVVSEKAMAQALPLLGAATGAALNAAFTDHFNRVARLHFGLKRLERQYGGTRVRLLYGKLLTQQRTKGLK